MTALGDTRTRVLLAVASLPGPVTVRGIGRAAGLAPSTVHWHLSALYADGLVEWDEGRQSTIRATVTVVAMCAHTGTFP